MLDNTTLTEASLRKMVNTYLADFLGRDYTFGSSVVGGNELFVYICYTGTTQKHRPVVGRLQVDAQTATIQPLDEEEAREVRECAAWEKAREKGLLARDEAGYLLRNQARRLARQWISDRLTMNFSATGGLFVPLDPPLWQFSVAFQMGDIELEPLATIDVHAQTGAIQPLSLTQLHTIKERVHAIVRYQALAAAA